MGVKVADRVAVISIDDDITDDWWGISYREINERISAENGNFDSVYVRVSSNGGSVTAGMAIRNLLLRLAENGMSVDVEIDGVAASIASIIALSGTSLKMRAGSYLMIHRPYTFAMGDHEELRNIATTVETMKDDLVTIYEENSTLSSSEIEAFMDNETWFSSTDAVKNGFAQESISLESGAVLNYLGGNGGRSVVMNSFKNVPKHILNSEVIETAPEEPQNEGGGKMALNAYLAKNPEDQKEFEAALAVARTEGSDGAKAVNAAIVARVKKIVASDSYKAPVRALAMEVLAGEKDVSALDAVVAIVDMSAEDESSTSAQAETEETGETSAEETATETAPEAKADGKITASNYKTFKGGN